MLPPFDDAQSRQTRATFFAAPSEIWFASKTFVAALALMTKSGDRIDFGAATAANLGTGALPGLGFGRGGRSCTSGGTDEPMTSVSALWAQIPSPHPGTRGAAPPTPTAPINCLLTTMGRPPEF